MILLQEQAVNNEEKSYKDNDQSCKKIAGQKICEDILKPFQKQQNWCLSYGTLSLAVTNVTIWSKNTKLHIVKIKALCLFSPDICLNFAGKKF